MSKKINTPEILAGLKDFQRLTAEYAFQRMYLDDSPTSRFLIADEVGLGKTLVARGIIAKCLDHLDGKVDRIDIIYVCSNAAIAKQNINRLNITGEKKNQQMATRLTMLPLHLADLKARSVNFVSFTPGTTFDLKSQMGIVDERAIIYHMLRKRVGLTDTRLQNLLQGHASVAGWRSAIKRVGSQNIDQEITEDFINHIRAMPGLMENLETAGTHFKRRKATKNIHQEARLSRSRIIGELRHLLAEVCVEKLEPDLVILDEFQRFKDLLHTEEPTAQLARDLMSFPDVRVLLLSATPYRMLTLDAESGDDHYPDFIKTLEFLFDDPAKVGAIRQNLEAFRRELYTAGSSRDSIATARDRVQELLKSVMVRTERVALSPEKDAMLKEEIINCCLEPEDLKQIKLVDSLAKELESGNSIEYWKSSPYLLNFMKGYKLRQRLEKEVLPDHLIDAIKAGRRELLSEEDFQNYANIDPANGRLRSLFDATLDQGQWRLLWIPPALPYIEPQDAYADLPDATKVLIFSSWNVAPDAIASLCSYEADRRMLERDKDKPPYKDLHDKRSSLIRFNLKADGAVSMPSLTLMYPCQTLARAIDPLKMAQEKGTGQPIPQEEALRQAEDIISEKLRATGLWPTTDQGREDTNWYWAALALLDKKEAPEALAWCRSAGGWRSLAKKEEAQGGGIDRGLEAHINAFAAALAGPVELGRAPADLITVLAEIALSGPAVCALRALKRQVPCLLFSDPAILNGATRIADGFRTMFNLPESASLLRSASRTLPYWRLVLEHSLDGNIQSVLDEYIHYLREALGLIDNEAPDTVTELSSAVLEALSIMTSSLHVSKVGLDESAGRVTFDPYSVRCRFALRLGDIKNDQGSALVRADGVRQAFNSPFRPFVLATTSVGQEGLDFHPYCHVLYHWNLPTNPVDLEQREGRIHRYKGHAIRKNISKAWGRDALKQHDPAQEDPWEFMFEQAAKNRPQGATELIPYWLYDIEDGAKVERRVPMLPYSREQSQLEHLKSSLAVYRLAFGQPRQQDLLAHVERLLEAGLDLDEIANWRISLAPPEKDLKP